MNAPEKDVFKFSKHTPDSSREQMIFGMNIEKTRGNTKNLRKLDIYNCGPKHFCIDAPFLASLHICHCKFSSLEGNFPKLRVLDISDCDFARLNCSFRMIGHISIFRGMLSSFSGEFPVLKVLSLDYNNIRNFDITAPLLKRLSLIANKLVSWSGSFPNLLDLSLSGNPLESFEGNFPRLKKLVITDTKLTRFFGTYPMLEMLWLNDNQLTDFGGLFPKIHLLNLAHNAFTTLSLSIETLNTLILTGCKNLVTLEGNIPSLRLLTLNGCVNLVSLPDCFPLLDELSFDWCPLEELNLELSSLTTCAFRYSKLVSFTGKFRKLRYANFHTSIRLEHIDIAAPELMTLIIEQTQVDFLDGDILTKCRSPFILEKFHKRFTTRVIRSLPLPIAEEIESEIAE